MSLRKWGTFLAACVIVAFTSGCSFGPIWSRTLTGQIVDAENGRPIPGAEVFMWYDMTLLIVIESISVKWNFNQTTTNSDGRFTIPGHFAGKIVAMGGIDSHPTLQIFHPDYGDTYIDPDEFAGWRDAKIALRENERDLDLLIDLDEACRWLGQEIYLYQLAFRPGACTWDRSAHP